MITRMTLEELGFVEDQEENLLQVWTNKKYKITVAYYPKDFPEIKKTYPDAKLLSLENLLELIVHELTINVALEMTSLSSSAWEKSGENIGELEGMVFLEDDEEEKWQEFDIKTPWSPLEPLLSMCFPVFYNGLLAGVVGFQDDFKIILMNDKYEFKANQKTYMDVEEWELPSGNGYQKGGQRIYKKEVQDSPYSIEFEQATWEASVKGKGLGPVTAAVLYDNSHPDMPLVASIRVGMLNWINKGEADRKWEIIGREVEPGCSLNIVGIKFCVEG